MRIKEVFADAKARFTGKRYGSNDIIILKDRFEDYSGGGVPLSVQEAIESSTIGEYVKPTQEERYEIALKNGHPKDWDEPYRGCGFGYGRAVNHYYEAVRYFRMKKLKKMLPYIASSVIIGSITGFTFWKSLDSGK